jgi:hypothetical protein
MSENDETRGLVESLGRGMTERLSAQGWTSMNGDRHASHRPPTVGAFRRALDDDFSAVVIFPSESKEWKPLEDGRVESSGLKVVGRIGVGYRPAEALISACTGSKVSGIVLNAPTISVTARVAADLGEAEGQLTDFVNGHALAFAERYTDVDSLIDALRTHVALSFTGEAGSWYVSLGIDPDTPLGPMESAEAELLPALLAIAGRDGAARTALADYMARDVKGIDSRAYHRFARQLTRRLDADEQLPFPSTPPQWPPPSSLRWKPQAMPSFAEFFLDDDRKAKARADQQARKQALEAVRAAGDDQSRDELRTRLEQELSERGLSTEPLLLERQVEMILADREPFGKMRFALRTLKALKDSSASPGRTLEQVSERPHRPGDDPDWLKSPDRAAYPVRSASPRRTPVELDPAAREWLERIKDSDPSNLARSRELEVWLTRDGGNPADARRTSVHVGAERVGVLRADVEQQFRPVLEAAAERDEDPWTRGRLSTTSGPLPFLLEVELPESVPIDDRPPTYPGDHCP